MKELTLGDALEDLIDYRGKTPRKLGTDFTESGVPVASALLVSNGTLNLADARTVSFDTYQSWMKTKTRKGDVLLTSEAPLGRVARVPSDDPLVLGQRLFGLRGRSGVLDNGYLFYALQTANVQADLVGRSSGTTVLGIRQSALRQIKISAPKFEEQRAIAEVLEAIDDKIAANSKLSETALGLLEAHFALLGLDLDPCEAGSIARLDELVTLNPKCVVSPEAESVYVDMKRLPTSNMSISGWNHRPAKGGARFMNGDTLLARITPCLENRKTGFVDFLEEDQVGIGSTEFIVLRSKPGVPVALSYYLATSARFRDFAIRHLVGTSGRQRVSALDLGGYIVSTPGEAALASFEKASNATFPFLKSLSDQDRTLTATRNALLPQLMSGKLRVRDAEKVLEDAGV